MKLFRKKNKIYNKYEDFFTAKDLKDPDTPQRINLTIDDFDAKGQVANPRAPCVVTTIDPSYIKDAALQQKTRKFRMKTDILMLREITRKKFVIYAAQQSCLEKQRENAVNEHIYKRIVNFQEFAANALCKMESTAFNELREAQKELCELEKVNLAEELNKIVAEHQKVLMEVQEVYGRFLFLLKLISYFDEIISPEDINQDDEEKSIKLLKPPEVFSLQISEYNSVGKMEISNIMAYMDSTIRPYLSKRNHLNADIWIKGYECTRQKIFNFNRRFSHLALLNHLVSVVYVKSEKTIARQTEKKIVLLDPKFLERRVEFLKTRSATILSGYERNQKKDKLQLKLCAVLPVILKRIELRTLETNDDNVTSSDKVSKVKNVPVKATAKKPVSEENETKVSEESQKDDILTYVRKLQWNLMNLLQDLEMYEPQKCRQIERRVRKRMEMEKDASRRALVKQTRLHDWMNHFRKHESLRRKD